MSHPEITYNLALLERSLAKWRSSAALRTVYGDMLRDLRNHLAPGRTLEIGSGIGVAKEFIPGLVTSDVVQTRFVDRAVSAYRIPTEEWDNIVAFDVLHHLCVPLEFFSSAAAALRPGGRVVLMEPAATPGARLFYRFFHAEPCAPRLIRPPFTFAADHNGEFANMGMAQGLFIFHRSELEERLVALRLRILRVEFRDVLAYPATGGFSQPALLPAILLRGLLTLEQALPQRLLELAALRMIVVLEKTTTA